MGLLPTAVNQSQDDEMNGEQMSTIFAFSKTCVAFGRDIFPPSHTRSRHPEGLYVINSTGVLSEFSLETLGVKQHNRVTDDSPVSIHANPMRRWPLQRQRSWAEIRAPLSIDSPLVLAAKCLTTRSNSTAELLKNKLESKRQRTASMSSRLAQDERKNKTKHSPRSRHSR